MGKAVKVALDGELGRLGTEKTVLEHWTTAIKAEAAARELEKAMAKDKGEECLNKWGCNY